MLRRWRRRQRLGQRQASLLDRRTGGATARAGQVQLRPHHHIHAGPRVLECSREPRPCMLALAEGRPAQGEPELEADDEDSYDEVEE